MYCVDGVTVTAPTIINIFVSPTVSPDGKSQLTYALALSPPGCRFLVCPLPAGPAELLGAELPLVPHLFSSLDGCFPSTVAGGGVASPHPAPPPPPPPPAPPLPPHAAGVFSAGDLCALLAQGGCSGAALAVAFPGSSFAVCAQPLPGSAAPWPAALALRHARPSASTLHVPLPTGEGDAGPGAPTAPLSWTLYSAGALREEGSWASGGKSAAEAWADIRQRHASGTRRTLLPPSLAWPAAGAAEGAPPSLRALIAHVCGAGGAEGGGPLLLRCRRGAAAPPQRVALLLQGAALPAEESGGEGMDVAKGGKSVSWG
jgi:hypothetical protein